MNTTQIVRTEADVQGVTLRLWIDDPDGRHVAVSECRIGEKTLISWGRAIAQEQNKAAQQEFALDQ